MRNGDILDMKNCGVRIKIKKYFIKSIDKTFIL
jgi:hypothetical protein